MTDRSKVGRSSRQKGSRGELNTRNEIVEALKPFGVKRADVCRTPGSGALIERGDLRLSARAAGLFPFFLEVKHREGWTFWQVFGAERSHVRVTGLHGWPPHEWFLDAEAKHEAERRRKFTQGAPDIKFATPVLLVLRQNRKKSLVMYDRGLETQMIPIFIGNMKVPLTVFTACVRPGTNAVTLDLNRYRIRRWDEFLGSWVENVQVSIAEAAEAAAFEP